MDVESNATQAVFGKLLKIHNCIMIFKTREITLPSGKTVAVIDDPGCYIQFEVDPDSASNYEAMSLYRYYEDEDLIETFDDPEEREEASKMQAFDTPIFISRVSSEGRQIMMNGQEVLAAYGLSPVAGFIYFIDNEEELSFYAGEWMGVEHSRLEVER